MTQTALYSGPTAADLARIPTELTALRQWVLWRGADRVNQQTGEVKLNKIPLCPQTLHNADTTDPLTWGTFEQCVAALPCALEEWEQEAGAAYRGGGIGFVLTSEDPYVGIDLDSCVDLGNGTLSRPGHRSTLSNSPATPKSPRVARGCISSPRAPCPRVDARRVRSRCIDYARFFTMTGWHVAGTPTTIEDRAAGASDVPCGYLWDAQGLRRTLYRQAWSPWTIPRSSPRRRRRRMANALQPSSRGWEGYSSQSEADMSLCVRLAFWSQSPEQIERLFRQSGLMRHKWDEKRGVQTYGARTIAEALARQTEHYRFVDASAQPGNGRPPGPAFDFSAFLAIVQGTEPADRLQVVLTAIDELAKLPLSTWIAAKHTFKTQVPALNLNDLERLRSHALLEARRQAVSGGAGRPTSLAPGPLRHEGWRGPGDGE